MLIDTLIGFLSTELCYYEAVHIERSLHLTSDFLTAAKASIFSELIGLRLFFLCFIVALFCFH